MNHGAKNKLLTGLVVLLLIANAATITMFWVGSNRPLPNRKGTPQEFLVKELKLDTRQQALFEVLRKEHHDSAMILRDAVKYTKASFFDLLKQSNVTDSAKFAEANKVSSITEKLDLLTLDHFQKLRAICNAEQQKKFDEIINQVIEMIAQPQSPGRGEDNRPPREGDDHKRPPVPGDWGEQRPGLQKISIIITEGFTKAPASK